MKFLFLIPILFFAFVIYVIYRSVKKMGQFKGRIFDSVLLAYLRRNNNRITIAEAAQIMFLSLDEAEAKLEKMRLQGAFELEMTDTGTMVYVLKQELGGLDKQQSRRLF
jgi:hypothetical protein